jgi:hypothetical protein
VACNNGQLHALVDAEAGILINVFPFLKNCFLLLSKIWKIKRISV